MNRDAVDLRVAELEARVRQLSDIVACIPMAAIGLDLVSTEEYAAALESPVAAMGILEKISGLAEKWLALQACGTRTCSLEEAVAMRRRSLEVELRVRGLRLPTTV